MPSPLSRDARYLASFSYRSLAHHSRWFMKSTPESSSSSLVPDAHPGKRDRTREPRPAAAPPTRHWQPLCGTSSAVQYGPVALRNKPELAEAARSDPEMPSTRTGRIADYVCALVNTSTQVTAERASSRQQQQPSPQGNEGDRACNLSCVQFVMPACRHGRHIIWVPYWRAV